MIKRYCWKLFVVFRFYARNDQPDRMKCSTNKVNTVHVRDQKHELTPPRDRKGTLRQRIARGGSSTVEGTVYKQAE
ncbi:hypothetical protein GQ457_05G022650 [Hibiscus cannabinus]